MPCPYAVIFMEFPKYGCAVEHLQTPPWSWNGDGIDAGHEKSKLEEAAHAVGLTIEIGDWDCAIRGMDGELLFSGITAAAAEYVINAFWEGKKRAQRGELAPIETVPGPEMTFG